MVSDVRFAQNIGFKFQVIQPVLSDIANADDPRQFPVAKHRHIAHAVAVIGFITRLRSSSEATVTKPCLIMSFTAIEASCSPKRMVARTLVDNAIDGDTTA